MMHPAHSAPLILRTADAESTQRLGAALGTLAQAGDVLLLRGDLGAGKTTFTQGFVRGAGSDELVNSPTFVLMNEYQGRVTVYHADLYRLDTPDEAAAMDLGNLSRDGVLVVEWPERGEDVLPREHLLVLLEHAGPTEREITLVPRGERAAAMLQAMEQAGLNAGRAASWS